MDRCFELTGGDVGGKAPFLEADAGEFRLGALVAHIDIDRRGVADGDRHQLGRETFGPRDRRVLAHGGDDALGNGAALEVAAVVGTGHGWDLLERGSWLGEL